MLEDSGISKYVSPERKMAHLAGSWLAGSHASQYTAAVSSTLAPKPAKFGCQGQQQQQQQQQIQHQDQQDKTTQHSIAQRWKFPKAIESYKMALCKQQCGQSTTCASSGSG
jgi:hypothetical protein